MRISQNTEEEDKKKELESQREIKRNAVNEKSMT